MRASFFVGVPPKGQSLRTDAPLCVSNTPYIGPFVVGSPLQLLAPLRKLRVAVGFLALPLTRFHSINSHHLKNITLIALFYY